MCSVLYWCLQSSSSNLFSNSYSAWCKASSCASSSENIPWGIAFPPPRYPSREKSSSQLSLLYKSCIQILDFDCSLTFQLSPPSPHHTHLIRLPFCVSLSFSFPLKLLQNSKKKKYLCAMWGDMVSFSVCVCFCCFDVCAHAQMSLLTMRGLWQWLTVSVSVTESDWQ